MPIVALASRRAVNIAGPITWQCPDPRVLRARSEALRDADPLHRPVFAHKAAPTIGAGQDWTYARCQDFLGSSCYPAWSPFQPWDDRPDPVDEAAYHHASLLAEMYSVALQYDYLRSCQAPGKPVWAAEFQGGPVNTGLHKGRVPSAEDLRRWMLTAVGSGVTALSFWVTRAEIMAGETNGFSLLDSTGDTTSRFEEASRLGQLLNTHPDLFGQPTWPGAPVALLVDEWNWQLERLLDLPGQLPYSVRGWHRLLWEAGIPVDFLEARHLQETDLSRYPALVWPFPLSASEDLMQTLSAYVAAGGNLISEACPGRLTPQGFASRGELSPAARELFGVEHDGLTMVSEPERPHRWLPRERTWGEFAPPTVLHGLGPLEGQQTRANFYLETFTCRGSEPCLLAGEAVAGTVRESGSGRAWLLGTLLGHSGRAYQEEHTPACVRALLARSGVSPAHPGRLLLRKRVTPAVEAWLFTNPLPVAVTEQVEVAGWEKVSDLRGEVLTRSGDEVVLTVAPGDVQALILQQA